MLDNDIVIMYEYFGFGPAKHYSERSVCALFQP